MANNPKHKDNLKSFKKGVDPNRNINGRPPKLLKHINDDLKKQGYERVSASQIAEVYELLFNLPEDKVKEIVADKTKPFFLRRVATAMGTARGIEMIEKMLDRAHGKAVQAMQMTGKDNEPINIQVTYVKPKGK